MNTYTQCHLIKGSEHRIAWIPAKFSHCKFLNINGDNGWEWEVVESYNSLSLGDIESNRDVCRHMKIVANC